MDNEAQVGALAKEAINLFTSGMGQQKKAEEKAGKAAITSAPVKDAKEKIERSAAGAAKSAVKTMADKAEKAADGYTIKFRKKQPPAKEAPFNADYLGMQKEAAASTVHRAAEAGKEAAIKAARTAAKGTEIAGKAAVAAGAPVSAPVIAGAKFAAAGAKAAAKGAKTLTGAGVPVSLRSAGTKAMENLIKNGGKGNKEARPVIPANDMGKAIAKNALVK